MRTPTWWPSRAGSGAGIRHIQRGEREGDAGIAAAPGRSGATSGTAARCTNGDSSTIQLGGVYIVLDDGEAFRAGWVAGCDGAHSRVRAAAVIELPGVLLVERFLLADVHVNLGLGEGHAAADGLVDLAPRALAGRQQLVAGSAERAARIRVAHEVFGWLVGGTGPMIEVGRAGKAGRHFVDHCAKGADDGYALRL